MSNDYFKAQGWFKNYALNSQDSRGMFQRLVKEDEEAFKLASAETDKIKNMINKKYGSGTMKYGSEISQPSTRPDVIEIDAINAFMKRNPAAEGGRIGFEKGLRVEDLSPLELRAAKKAARDRGISGTVDNPEFIKFLSGDDYVRKSTVEKEAAKKLGISYKKYQKLSFPERKKLRTNLFNKKVKESSKFLRPEASVEEVIETIYTNPEKISNFNKNTLNNYYRKWFREEYDNLVKSGEPFARTEVSGRVIQRIKDTYTRDGVLPKEFLPGYTDNPGTKNYDEFFVPKNPKDKIFSDAELKTIKSAEGSALKKTKNNLRIFNALYDGVNEVDDIAKMLDMPVSEVRATVNTVMNGMTRTQLPFYLQDKIDDFGTVINNLAGSESLDDLWRRNTKTLIYSAFPEDSKNRNRAFQKVDEFEKYIKDIKKQFPGLQIAYDHPAGYAALKSQNINNFLNITPIANDINIFKGNFDTKSKNNLVAMDKALKNGDITTYKSLLKDQRKLEKLWSNLTGGKSTLGKIRLGKVIDYGTGNILEDQKSFADEFKNNIKIRENISKNLTDENIKIMNEVFPGGKYYKTKMLESAKKITSPDLVNFDKQIESYITDTTGKVKQPMFSSGFAGAYEMLSDDLKKITNTEGFKKFSKIAKTPGKFFGIGDVVLGYLDYKNNLGKYGDDERGRALSLEKAKQAMSFGLWKGGDRKYIEQLKETYIKNGGDDSVFDQVISLNKQNSELMSFVEKTKEQYQRELENEKTYGTAGGPEAIKFQLDVPSASDTLKNNLSAIKTKAENMDKDFTTFTETYKGTDLTQPSKDIKAAAFEDLAAQKRKVFDTQSKQLNTEAGPIGNWLLNNLFTLDPLGKAKEQAYITEMAENYPQELYRYNLERGVDPDNPVTFDATSNLIAKPELGFNFSEGGITSLRSKYEYKK
jgi:hypothetical protein